MFFFAFPVFFFCSVIGSIQSSSSLETVSRNVSVSCEPYETQCALGCCPYADAVCCADGYECCQHGQTCIPIIGICIGALNDNGKVSLVSEKSTRIRSNFLTCPPGMTECAPDRCCQYEQAVCCEDGEHCCPNGYRCDIPHQLCVKNTATSNDKSENKFHPLPKMSKKSSYKSCPNGRQMCPNHMNCCVDGNGQWGCCPNPSLPEVRKGDNDCCTTFLGYVCCTALFPTCTFLGCI